jgi:hypothetical protein
MRSEITNVRRLEADLSRLEIGFHAFNRTLLWATAILSGAALIYFVYSTIEQKLALPKAGLLFILFFYLVLPVAIFLWSSAIVWRRCRTVVASIDAAEKRYSAAKLSA